MKFEQLATEDSIRALLEKFSKNGIVALEEQIFAMMQNKVNFLSQQGNLFPQFSSINSEEKESIEQELRKIATSIASQKVSNNQELVDGILFAVLSILSKQMNKKLEQSIEVTNKKKEEENLSDILKQSALNYIKKILKESIPEVANDEKQEGLKKLSTPNKRDITDLKSDNKQKSDSFTGRLR